MTLLAASSLAQALPRARVLRRQTHASCVFGSCSAFKAKADPAHRSPRTAFALGRAASPRTPLARVESRMNTAGTSIRRDCLYLLMFWWWFALLPLSVTSAKGERADLPPQRAARPSLRAISSASSHPSGPAGPSPRQLAPTALRATCAAVPCVAPLQFPSALRPRSHAHPN